MTEINYSVIIPHKNIPTLLQHCIDSIPRRDDVQIIVVDDNSDPEKVDFDNFPGKDDPHVELYFTKEGKGAGYARNVGLEHAKGKWLLFADADDYFLEDLNRLMNDYLNSNSDIIFLYNKTVDLHKGFFLNIDQPVAIKYIKCNCSINDYDALRFECYPPWTKMVRRQLVNSHNITFDQVKASNDVFFSVKVGYYAKNVEICPYVIYMRVVRQGSLQYSYSEERLLDRIKVGYNVNEFLNNINMITHYAPIAAYILQLRKKNIFLFLKHLFLFFVKSPHYILKDSFLKVFKRRLASDLRYCFM